MKYIHLYEEFTTSELNDLKPDKTHLIKTTSTNKKRYYNK